MFDLAIKRLLRTILATGLACLISANAVAASSYAKSYSRSDGAEDFIGFFGGNFSPNDSDVTVTFTCGSCNTTPQTSSLSFDSGSVIGLRSGLWGINELDVFGFAIEISKTLASGRLIDVDYSSISLMPMLRIPLLTSSSMPGGHVNLYAGVSGDWIFSGNMSVRIPPSGTNPTYASGSMTGNGYSLMAGVIVKFSHFSISGEYRDVTMNTKFANADNYGNAKVSGPQAIVTLGYLF